MNKLEDKFDISAFNESRKSLNNDRLQAIGYFLAMDALFIQGIAKRLVETFTTTDGGIEDIIPVYAKVVEDLEEQIEQIKETYGVNGFTLE